MSGRPLPKLHFLFEISVGDITAYLSTTQYYLCAFVKHSFSFSTAFSSSRKHTA